jgi:hypothetical protein
MANEGSDPYKVIIPKQELDKLRKWGEWADGVGARDDYLVALKTINYRLSFEPTEWGEPRYTLHEMKLAVRFGTFKMINVWYGVHLEKQIVFVKVFQFRGDYPHGQPPESS